MADLEAKDVLLAKTVLDIHRKRTHSAFVFVPLSTIMPIHAIDRKSALVATQGRVETLTEKKGELCKKGKITKDRLAEYLPSISWIKVVRESSDCLIAYEGNGRLAALQIVFCEDDNILIEVEEYYFRNPLKILHRMNRVRRLNGLI